MIEIADLEYMVGSQPPEPQMCDTCGHPTQPGKRWCSARCYIEDDECGVRE